MLYINIYEALNYIHIIARTQTISKREIKTKDIRETKAKIITQNKSKYKCKSKEIRIEPLR